MENTVQDTGTTAAQQILQGAVDLTAQAVETPSRVTTLAAILQAMERELIAQWEFTVKESLRNTTKSIALLLLVGVLQILLLLLVFLARLSRARAHR